eukprot:gnl/MRDRNA2_/MRDRNA2_76895_c0_seq2.p1 gnl/MRDRNA2_/MRDRNA2_76895_c0~~gnl/MRDRNA2_/MRDRNA2_76895_c0_seq2.p1  ORF type:complete len:499 (-),score=54.91 gnl/MRDRNA2_/MRDRNA2_76895_c0_seq2:42-1436(-)
MLALIVALVPCYFIAPAISKRLHQESASMSLEGKLPLKDSMGKKSKRPPPENLLQKDSVGNSEVSSSIARGIALADSLPEIGTQKVSEKSHTASNRQDLVFNAKAERGAIAEHEIEKGESMNEPGSRSAKKIPQMRSNQQTSSSIYAHSKALGLNKSSHLLPNLLEIDNNAPASVLHPKAAYISKWCAAKQNKATRDQGLREVCWCCRHSRAGGFTGQLVIDTHSESITLWDISDIRLLNDYEIWMKFNLADLFESDETIRAKLESRAYGGLHKNRQIPGISLNPPETCKATGFCNYKWELKIRNTQIKLKVNAGGSNNSLAFGYRQYNWMVRKYGKHRNPGVPDQWFCYQPIKDTSKIVVLKEKFKKDANGRVRLYEVLNRVHAAGVQWKPKDFFPEAFNVYGKGKRSSYEKNGVKSYTVEWLQHDRSKVKIIRMHEQDYKELFEDDTTDRFTCKSWDAPYSP